MTIEELAAQVAALQSAMEDQAAELESMRQSVPTSEQLLTTATFPVGSSGSVSLTVDSRITLMIAPFPLRILSVAMSIEYGTVAESDTSYWIGTLESGTGAAGFPNIAAKTTQKNGALAGGAINARTPWTWDSANWNAEAAVLAKGQLLCVNWDEVGTPAALRFPQVYTIRYLPL